MAEYRIWITIPRMPVAEEGVWEPLITDLEQRHPAIGPVMGWTNDEAEIVVSMNVRDEAAAAERAVAAVIDSLRAVGLEDRYPARLVVEPAEEEHAAITA